MRFTKPALTIDEQVELLVSRGLEGDRARIQRRLEMVNYYRLAAYWHTFREPDSSDLRPGAHIDTVWDRYLFDRRLRLLVLDGLERFEVTVRTRLAYELAMATGPFGYCEGETLFQGKPKKRTDLLAQLSREFGRSREDFLIHFRRKYGDEHGEPPVWVAVELMSFGAVVTLFQGSPRTVVGRVASFMGVPALVLESWLRCLNMVRNICAHHGRLWNRTLGIRPMIPRARTHPEWHAPITVEQDKVFAPLTILAYTLGRVAPNTGWARRFEQLLGDHPEIPLAWMGIGPAWRSSPMWARLLTTPHRESEKV